MRVVLPVSITPASLISTSVAEPATGETSYAANITYAKGARAISTSTHRLYESLKPGNQGNPLPEAGVTATEWWLDLGPTMRWRMFDQLRNTGTSGPSPLSVTVTPGQRINTLAMLGIVADSAQITMVSNGQTVYQRTVTFSERRTISWTGYYFGEYRQRPNVPLFDLPPYAGAQVTVTFTRAAGDVTVGALIFGTFEELGEVQLDAESDATNYSVVERDVFGETATLVQRRSVPRATVTVWCENTRVRRITEIRAALNAVPALWSAIDDAEHPYFDPLLILGIYKRFTISMAQPDHAVISLDLEEV